jgi:hypothetical protein
MKPYCLLALLLLVGCIGVPKNKERGGSTKSAEELNTRIGMTVEKVVDGTPPPAPVVVPPANVNVTGDGDVTINPQPIALEKQSPYHVETKLGLNTSAAATTSKDDSWYSRVKIPLWVAVIGMGIGLCILGAAGFVLLNLHNKLKQTSVAYAATSSLADNAMARVASIVDSHARAATDHGVGSLMNQVKAEIETARGKVAAASPPRKVN